MYHASAARQLGAFQRSGRFFHATLLGENSGGWYFRTREGMDYGPFLTLPEAQQRCDLYIQQCIASHATGRRA